MSSSVVAETYTNRKETYTLKLTSSYGMKLNGDLKALDNSIAIYRDALNFVIPIVDKHWDEIKDFKSTKFRMSYIDTLVHTTKSNEALYDFDIKFPKLPSYLRRATLNKAIGIVSSYRSHLANWEEKKVELEAKGEKVPQRPRLETRHFDYPAYYKQNLFRNFNPITQTIELKVFKNGDWVYETYTLKTSDCNYYQKYLANKKQNVPVIKKKGRSFYATFSYEENVPLIAEDKIEKICAIDLGLNTDATCCIMGADGTVYARKFISFSKEHDQLDTQLGRIKRNQKQGSRHNKTLWRKVSGLSQDIADKTVKAIFDFGNEHGVDVFVLEYLDFKGKNTIKRARFWRYKRIYKVLSNKAHQYGLRVTRVNAQNTSRLAFDGTGWSKRGREITSETPYAIIQFMTGKLYNADLNAAYNIGARYFIRHLLKTVTVTQRLALEAKVPQVTKRSTCTLSHLINLRSELAILIARTQA
jgi:IS605 OrfB family transposase